MRRPRLLPVLLGLFLLLSQAASAKLSHEALEAAVDQFNEELRNARSGADLLPLSFVEFEGRNYACSLPRRFVRLATKSESFTIDRVRYFDTYVQIHLISTNEARVSMFVFDDRIYAQSFLDAVVPMVLAETFEFREPQPGSRYVGNLDSGLYHLRGCNHLPDEAVRREFADRGQAGDAGFDPCTICFATEHMLPIDGYVPTRIAALDNARVQEIASPPVEDPSLQARIQQAGEDVLSAFPIELQGFDYVFKVLHSELPNAFSFPTGFVYVTDKLVSAIEDSLELAFILAHEVAHTEVQRRVKFNAGPGDLYDIVAAYDQYYDRLRFQETEADVLALMTISRQGEWTEVTRRARGGLTKLQMVSQSLPIGVESKATHPGFAFRLGFVDPSLFFLGEGVCRFRGVNKTGDTVAHARFIGSRQFRVKTELVDWELGGSVKDINRVYYYFLVEASDLLNDPFQSGDGSLIDEEGRKAKFSSDLFPFPVEPGKYGIVYFSGKPNDWSVETVARMELDISDEIEEWLPEDSPMAR